MVQENLTVVSAVIKPGIMVMLLLSFSAFSATTTTKKTSSSRGNEPPLLPRPFAPSRFEKIVTNVVYYTVAFFSVHNSFVKWNNNLLHGKYKLFCSLLQPPSIIIAVGGGEGEKLYQNATR